jgi:hypothetical protein
MNWFPTLFFSYSLSWLYWVEVNLVIRSRYVPLFWTATTEFAAKKGATCFSLTRFSLTRFSLRKNPLTSLSLNAFIPKFNNPSFWLEIWLFWTLFQMWISYCNSWIKRPRITRSSCTAEGTWCDYFVPDQY